MVAREADQDVQVALRLQLRELAAAQDGPGPRGRAWAHQCTLRSTYNALKRHSHDLKRSSTPLPDTSSLAKSVADTASISNVDPTLAPTIQEF